MKQKTVERLEAMVTSKVSDKLALDILRVGKEFGLTMFETTAFLGHVFRLIEEEREN